MPNTPGTPPRRVPNRGHTRPGTRREARLASGQGPAAGAETTVAMEDSVTQVTSRRKAVSGLALSMTHRLIALAATVAILAISFISSLGVYFGQQHAIAEEQARIDAHNAEITRLQDELERWKDPAYVRAQARERLGWVLPGEIGYRVVDANGQIIGGSVGGAPVEEETTDQVWYEQLWASVQMADEPVVVEPTPTVPPEPVVIGPDSEGPR